MKEESIHISERPHLALPILALSPAEAAEALGVCERTFRSLMPEIPVVRVGRRVLIPVDGLRRWLEGKARVELPPAENMTPVAHEFLSKVLGSDPGSR